MSIGVSVGVAIGVATDNIAIGMSIGIGAGLCLGGVLDAINRKKQEDSTKNNDNSLIVLFVFIKI